MRRMLGALAVALVAAATVEAGYGVVRLTDVVVLAREGVSDRTIISFLENRELAFVVGTEEILRLRDAGVGEEVVRYLIERTAPRDSYASDPYAYRPGYADYGGSPYDEPGYGGADIEYGPSYTPSYYVGASIGPYVTYDRYYGGGLGGWLARTFGFGHRYGRHYVSRYDHRGYDYGRRDYDYGRRYYDRGRSYDHGRSYHDRGRSFSYAPHYTYSYRSNPGRGYQLSYGRSSGRESRSPRSSGEHAVPRGRGRH